VKHVPKCLANKKISLGVAIMAIITLAIVIGGIGPNFAEAHTASYSATLPTMSLTIIGRDGTTKLLNSSDIGSLSNVTGVGGGLNQLGNIINYANWTGVPFKVLCDQIGGIEKGDFVKVTASDSYSTNFTYDQVVNGSFVAYDPATMNNVTNPPPLAPIIAYYKNFTNVSDKGPLRVAIVGSQGYITDSTLWEYEVVKFQILPNQVPEFTSVFILPLLAVLATLVIAQKIHRTRHCPKKVPSNKYCDTIRIGV
jgi:hypothetical protein